MPRNRVWKLATRPDVASPVADAVEMAARRGRRELKRGLEPGALDERIVHLAIVADAGRRQKIAVHATGDRAEP